MSAGKKRQTMAKQARERAVREKRELKRERKREAAHLRLAGDPELADMPEADDTTPRLRLVTDEEPASAGADTSNVERVEIEPVEVERVEVESRGADA